MFKTDVLEKINTHFVFHNFCFGNRAVYEVMCKNMAERVRPQMTIWCMGIACCIPKATNTHSIRNTHCFSATTVVARSRLIVTLYVHCLSCFSPGNFPCGSPVAYGPMPLGVKQHLVGLLSSDSRMLSPSLSNLYKCLRKFTPIF